MLTIGNIKLDNPFVLAPLAGYTDLPFRLLCKEFGAGLCVSEMISCHGLFYKQPKTLVMLESDETEKPVSFQLFGAEPEIMARATEILSAYNPDIIDINMGCPVRKVTKKGAGSAMMATPELAREVIHSVINNCDCPVTVKFRSGVKSTSITAVEFGQMAESAGVSAVTVHGRTWAQGFTGNADWTVIKSVKDALQIPVIGNGDILQYSDGLRMMEETGCDGVMIGRGALGNPWVFSQEGKPHSLVGVVEGVVLHLELMEKYLPVDRMFGVIRNHIGRYFKGLSGSSNMRKKVYESTDFFSLKSDMEALIGK